MEFVNGVGIIPYTMEKLKIFKNIPNHRPVIYRWPHLSLIYDDLSSENGDFPELPSPEGNHMEKIEVTLW